MSSLAVAPPSVVLSLDFISLFPTTMKRLNSGHPSVLKDLSVIEGRPLLSVILKRLSYLGLNVLSAIHGESAIGRFYCITKTLAGTKQQFEINDDGAYDGNVTSHYFPTGRVASVFCINQEHTFNYILLTIHHTLHESLLLRGHLALRKREVLPQFAGHLSLLLARRVFNEICKCFSGV